MHDEDSDEVDLRCPQIVADNAAKGLRLRKEFGRGGTEIGVARATELKNREKLSPSTIRRRAAISPATRWTSAARTMATRTTRRPAMSPWLLWGGDEGRAWALEIKRRIGNAPDI